MMKKFLPTLLMAVCLTAGVARAADDVVFVDLQEVFKRFYKTQLAQDQIRQQADDIKLEREEMEEEIKVMKESVEVLRADSRDNTLSEEIRENKRNQLEEKLVDLQKKELEMVDFQKLRMEQLEQQNKRMTLKLFDEIHESIIIYSRAKGYTGVIDRSAQSRAGMQTVLYANPSSDVTAEIVEALNEGREVIVVEDPSQKEEQ